MAPLDIGQGIERNLVLGQRIIGPQLVNEWYIDQPIEESLSLSKGLCSDPSEKSPKVIKKPQSPARSGNIQGWPRPRLKDRPDREDKKGIDSDLHQGVLSMGFNPAQGFYFDQTLGVIVHPSSRSSTFTHIKEL